MKKSKILKFPKPSPEDPSNPFNTPEMKKMFPHFLRLMIRSKPFAEEGADLINEFANEYNKAVMPTGPFLEPRSPEMMMVFMKILETIFINWMRFTFQSHDLVDKSLPPQLQKKQIRSICSEITQEALDRLKNAAPYVLDGMQGLEGHDFPLRKAVRVFENQEDDSTNHPRH